MPDLAQNLFLRELAKRDADKARQRVERQDQLAEQQASAESLDRAISRGGQARDDQFKRHLDVAKLAGKEASQLGKKRPEYQSAAVDESSGLGFDLGEVEKKQLAEKQAEARALEILKGGERRKLEEFKAGESKTLEGLRGKNAMDREQAGNESSMSVASMAQTHADERAAADRALREKLFGQGHDPNQLTKGALGREQTKEGKASQRINDIRGIRDSFKNDQGQVDYYRYLSPNGKNRADELERKADSGMMSPEERTEYQKHVRARAAIATLKNQVFHDWFGASQSETEARRAADAIGTYAQDPDQFKAILDEMERNAKRERATSMTQMGQSGIEEDLYSYEEAEPPPPEEGGFGSFGGSLYRKIKKMVGASGAVPAAGITVHE